MSQNDPAVNLNNLLQARRETHLLRWEFAQNGRLDQAIHYATAYLGDQEIGRGQGTTRNGAKRDASARALQTLGAA